MGQCSPIHPLEVKLHVRVKQTALLLCVWAVMSSNLLPQTQYCTRFFVVFHSTWSDVRTLYLKLGDCFFLRDPVQFANHSTFNATHSALLTAPLNMA